MAQTLHLRCTKDKFSAFCGGVRGYRMSVRNRQAFERGQEHRAQLKAIMLDHQRCKPLARALTAKELHARYPFIKPSTIAWHVAELRYEAAAASLMTNVRGDGGAESASDSL
jgi:hypothetical protein